MDVKLGDMVRDRVTGFEGITVSRIRFLNGCDRFDVQPKVTTEGQLPESKIFDEPDLIVLAEAVVEPPKEEIRKKTGGPHDHMSRYHR